MAEPTLLELMRTATTPFEAGVIKNIVDHFPYMEKFPVVTKGALYGRYREWQTLPTTGTRKLNDTFDSDYGTMQAKTYSVPIYGSLIRADEQFLSEPDGKEWLADQIEMHQLSTAYKIANDLVVGDSASDPETMDGLKVWSTLLPSRLTIDASGLDLDSTADREANAGAFATYLDRAIQRGVQFNGGLPDFGLVPNDMEWILPDAWRSAGYLKTTEDSVGRQFTSYRGVPLIPGGFTLAGAFDAGTEILTNSHDGTYTSIYFVWTGEKKAHLVQKHRLRVVRGAKNNGDDSTEDNLIYSSTKLEWPVMLLAEGRSVVRLKGLDIS